MDRRIRQILCVFLSVVLLVSVFPVVSARQCRTENFSDDYELTGFGPDDMIAIAMAQLGKTGTQMKYTEEWCADFVSDCAILAGQTDAIPAYAYCYGLYYAILESGGKKTTSDPKPGDICFINWQGGTYFKHVEIVYKVEDGMVYTIGGNTGGLDNLYIRKVALHDPLPWDVIAAIVRPAYQVLDISYATKCRFYDTYCHIRATQTTDLMTQPCDGETDTESVSAKSVQSGKKLKATAVVENTLGQLWYQVKNGDDNVYIRAADTEFLGEIQDSVTLSDFTPPEKLEQGTSFRLQGSIRSKGIDLTSVTGKITQGSKELMSVTAEIFGSTCQLRTTAVNQELKFASLAAGEYAFTIEASGKGYYASGDQLKTYKLDVTLYSGKFQVAGHTCQFEFEYMEAEHPHINVYSCPGCGKIKREKKETNLLEDCTQCYPPPVPAPPVLLPEDHRLFPDVICFHPFFASCNRCEE